MSTCQIQQHCTQKDTPIPDCLYALSSDYAAAFACGGRLRTLRLAPLAPLCLKDTSPGHYLCMLQVSNLADIARTQPQRMTVWHEWLIVTHSCRHTLSFRADQTFQHTMLPDKALVYSVKWRYFVALQRDKKWLCYVFLHDRPLLRSTSSSNKFAVRDSAIQIVALLGASDHQRNGTLPGS